MGVPLTPQTDPKNFPVWEENAPPGQSGHPYPRMITRPFTEKDRDEWINRHRKVDRITREEYFEERVPFVGSQVPYLATAEMVAKSLCRRAGEPVIAESEAQEKDILAFLGVDKPEPKPEPVNAADLMATNDGPDPLDALKAQNAELRRQLAEKRELEAELAGPKDKIDKRTKAGKAAAAKFNAEFAQSDSKVGSGYKVPNPAMARARAKAQKAMSAAQLAGDEE